MTHSPVYYDGYLYVTLVAHVAGVNELIDPKYEGAISGLLEYSLYPGDGVLRVYDLDDNVTYEVHTVEDWEGLDKSAVQALLDAVDGKVAVPKDSGEYVRLWNAYMRTGDPVAALTKHVVGTVVRIDHGAGPDGPWADILIKRDVNQWEVAGSYLVWSDAQVEAENYEVIYSV